VGLSQSRTPSSGSFFRSSSPWRLSPVLVDGTLLWETTAAYLPSCTAFSSVPERLRCEVRQRERERAVIGVELGQCRGGFVVSVVARSRWAKDLDRRRGDPRPLLILGPRPPAPRFGFSV
jgi:hypothetical protein